MLTQFSQNPVQKLIHILTLTQFCKKAYLHYPNLMLSQFSIILVLTQFSQNPVQNHVHRNWFQNSHKI